MTQCWHDVKMVEGHNSEISVKRSLVSGFILHHLVSLFDLSFTHQATP